MRVNLIIWVMLFPSLKAGQAWTLANLEIYQRLSKTDVSVSPRGDVFILHPRESAVLHYDVNGRKLGRFGRGGDGPGELGDCFYLYHLDGKVYVNDNRGISVFTEEGAFVAQLKVPHRGFPVKLMGGWVLAGNEYNVGAAGGPRLFWFNDSFQEKRVALKWPLDGDGGAVPAIIKGNEVFVHFNPVRAHTLMKRSPDNRRIYVLPPNGNTISVIEGEGKIAATIKLPWRPIAFNLGWGKEKLAEAKASDETDPRTYKYEVHFPDYFPLVKDMSVGPEGNLYLSRWSWKAEGNQTVLDPGGNEVTPAFDPNLVDQILALQNGWAFVLLWDKIEEVASMGKCRVENVKAFLAGFHGEK